ncbi:MAG: 2-oxoacid:acceptor oxidoreductase subunit alpha [Actinobacteria bacterium]|nr:MAG: 2-oxoacid:acceptor oxidoreductase subunit alpha [Actinomycetota bacterium]
MTRPVTDFNAMVAGQGGDGSLTVITLLGNLLARRGFHLYTSRNVGSQVKGGHTAGLLRGTMVPRTGMGDSIDVFIAFDAEAIEKGGSRVAQDGFVVYDSSGGPLPDGHLSDGVTVLEIPFGRLAVRDLRRELFKNSFALGVISRILTIDDADTAAVIKARFAAKPELVDPNLQAMIEGFAYADEHDMAEGAGPIRLAKVKADDRILITGNDAAALGFLVAGVRFFAGYPITPATEILDFMTRHIEAYGGVAVQAEDELAAVNMALGAALTGVRSLTATSGPGISLMQEAVSHAGSAEIPLVVVDAQRAGPSTGMPTKSEQSDIAMLIHGGNGDFPRIVLAAGNATDAFELAVIATNLSQRIQGPVYLMLDQTVSQDSSTVPPFDLTTIEIDHGRRLNQHQLDVIGEYRRYSITDDGVSPWAMPGMPDGMSLVTGNEHDEWGKVSTEPRNRVDMMDKRARKTDAVLDDLPSGHRFGDDASTVGILGVGMQSGVMRETVELLASDGIELAGLQPRTIWPVPAETLAFVASKERVYVVEHNHSGQLAQILESVGHSTDTMRSILKYDGIAFTPLELADRIRTGEAG